MLTVEPTGPHTATVVFLHGFGDTGMGWEFMGGRVNDFKPLRAPLIDKFDRIVNTSGLHGPGTAARQVDHAACAD